MDDLLKPEERAVGRWGEDARLSSPAPLLGVGSGSADERAGSGGGYSLASDASKSSVGPRTLCGTCNRVGRSRAGQSHRAVRAPYVGRASSPAPQARTNAGGTRTPCARTAGRGCGVVRVNTARTRSPVPSRRTVVGCEGAVDRAVAVGWRGDRMAAPDCICEVKLTVSAGAAPALRSRGRSVAAVAGRMAEAGRERRTCTVRPELGRCGGTGVGSRSMKPSSIESSTCESPN